MNFEAMDAIIKHNPYKAKKMLNDLTDEEKNAYIEYLVRRPLAQVVSPIIEPPIEAIYPYQQPEREPITTITVTSNSFSDFLAKYADRMISKCSNCKFWEKYDDDGICLKFSHEYGENLARISYDDSSFETKPDFGCIQFEAKDAE